METIQQRKENENRMRNGLQKCGEAVEAKHAIQAVQTVQATKVFFTHTRRTMVVPNCNIFE
jgi:hypothetical protein